MQVLQRDVIFAGRYRVLRRLASGGMGAIYQVVHTETDRQHALKVLLPSLVDRDEARERFKKEARITANIKSESIVHVFDAGVDLDTGMPFIVMELLDGEDLDAKLKRDGAMDPALAVDLLAQIARALDQTHAAQIVHRDIKPENIFLTPGDDGCLKAKLLDFGVAKMVVEGASAQAGTTSFGTPLYMGP